MTNRSALLSSPCSVALLSLLLGCSPQVTIGSLTGGGSPGTSTDQGADTGAGAGASTGTGTGTCSDTGTHTLTDTDWVDVAGCGSPSIVSCSAEAGDACVCTALTCVAPVEGQAQVFEVHCAGPQDGVAQCDCRVNAASVGTCAQPVQTGCNTCELYRNCCKAFWPVHVD